MATKEELRENIFDEVKDYYKYMKEKLPMIAHQELNHAKIQARLLNKMVPGSKPLEEGSFWLDKALKKKDIEEW